MLAPFRMKIKHGTANITEQQPQDFSVDYSEATLLYTLIPNIPHTPTRLSPLPHQPFPMVYLLDQMYMLVTCLTVPV